ncbi:MAG: hypothetical protein Q8T11_17595 [Elusimicrobiota bacterium]|nr:hypothetical protein [Elusimicrobiota bacterium]
MRRLVLVLASAGFSACAALPPGQPASLEHGLLIARVEVSGAVFSRFFKFADAGSIVGLDAKGVPLPGQRGLSGPSFNGYVVFYNVPPGRYTLRSASFKARGARYQVQPPPADEAKRSVVLKPGAAAYLGSYRFDSRWPEFWSGTGRAARIVAHWLTPFLRRPLIPRDTGQAAYETEPAHEARALFAVREGLAGTQWSEVAAARLRELGAAEPAKRAGVVRSRPLPLREEPFVSWRDTLKWGEPRRVASGMAWRRPGGEAQIAIFHTTATAPGFAGWEAAVSELRAEAATSVEDRGGVYEVVVGTRTGLAARTTKYVYPQGTLVGSETKVVVTETTIVPDGYGIFTSRLRAPRAEFPRVLAAYREFLLQLSLGPPAPKAPPRQEAVLPFSGGGP